MVSGMLHTHACNYHAHHCSLPSKIALMWGREFVRPHRRKNNVGGTLHRYKGSFYIATIFFYRLYVYLNFKFYFTCMRMMITCPDFSDPAYISMSTAISNLEIAPAVVVWLSRLAHVMLSVAVVHLILDCEWWAKWCAYCLCATGQSTEVRSKISVQVATTASTGYNVRHNIDDTRADKQPSSTLDWIKLAKKQSYCVKSFDDGSSYNEGAFTSGYCTTSSNYSDSSYRSRIVGGGNVKITRSMLQGTESVATRLTI